MRDREKSVRIDKPDPAVLHEQGVGREVEGFGQTLDLHVGRTGRDQFVHRRAHWRGVGGAGRVE